jgi:acyl transferase domain-containing protein
LNPTPKRGYRSVPDGPFSPDGHCRVFDAKAAGMIPADGVGVVVLKRLADALADHDRILAVVKGTAINNDGRRKAGFTAPSPLGQAEVIMTAQAAAGVSADSIGYVEAHGTATPVGDPIEVQALTDAFTQTSTRTGFCALGSVKSNIGHTDTAAGIAGLIKAVLAVHHATIPASINFTDPNPLLDLDRSPFYVNQATIPWPAEAAPRRAGVSSFGVGGTNAHVILEQAPTAPREPAGAADPCPLVVISARTATALRQSATDLANHLAAHPDLDLADVAYTSQVTRRALAHRQALVCPDGPAAVEQLRAVADGPTPAPAEERPVVFLFPGTGAHYDGMGRELYETERVFRDEIDRCAEIILPVTRRDLRTVLYDDGAHPVHGDHTYHLDGAARTGRPMVFAALLATEYAMARWLMSVGVRPAAMLGHSFGEYTAACLSGVLSLDDALRLVVERERLFALAGGTTYSVALGERELRPYLTGSLSLAAVNGPANCAVSGSVDDVTGLAARLAETGVKTHQLRVSTAMHSALLEPVLGRYAQTLRTVRFGTPRIPYISTVTGTRITAEQAGDPGYWVRQSRQTVRFADGLDECSRLAPVFVEVGPEGGLGKLARRQLGRSAVTVPTIRHAYADQADQPFLRGALGQLWQHGVSVDWSALHTGRHRRRVQLPGYPFERRRFWIDPPGTAAPVPAEPADPAAPPRPGQAAGSTPRPPLPQPYVAARTPLERQLTELWERTLGISPIGVHDNFFDLGGESLVVLQIVAAIRDQLGVALSGRQLFISHRLTVAGFAAEIAERQAQREEP